MSFGPPLVVAEEFAEVRGIEGLWLYGSWAARHAGVPGRAPADVDVLVVGDVDRDEVYDAARRAERRLGREVTPTIRNIRAWKQADDAFTATVKDSPMLPLAGPLAEPDRNSPHKSQESHPCNSCAEHHPSSAAFGQVGTQVAGWGWRGSNPRASA